MKLYILRHGQTNYNIEGKFQGQVDTQLNENGRKQVEDIAKELKLIPFDIIISSPLIRAVDTAKAISDSEIRIDNRIIERSFGVLEGKYSVPDYEENIEKYNIESLENLTKRVYEFLNEIKKEDYKNVLIVTHEAIAQIIEMYFKGVPESNNIKDYRLPTATYKIFEF